MQVDEISRMERKRTEPIWLMLFAYLKGRLDKMSYPQKDPIG